MYREEIITVEEHRYTVRLEPQPEGGFTVTVPALPEVVTEGDTLAEAMAMAEDAIRSVFEWQRNSR